MLIDIFLWVLYSALIGSGFVLACDFFANFKG